MKDSRTASNVAYCVFYIVLFAILYLTFSKFDHSQSPGAAIATGAVMGLVLALGQLFIAEPIRRRVARQDALLKSRSRDSSKTDAP